MITVEFYKDRARKHRWRAKAQNGRLIADCGQGYKTLRGAEKGFRALESGLDSHFAVKYAR